MIRILILGLLCSGSALIASCNIPMDYMSQDVESVVIEQPSSSNSIITGFFKAIGIAAAVIVGTVVVGVIAVGFAGGVLAAVFIGVPL